MVEGILDAGKKRLPGDTALQATSAEVKDLRAESLALKEVVADLKPREPPAGLAPAAMVGAGTFDMRPNPPRPVKPGGYWQRFGLAS